MVEAKAVQLASGGSLPAEYVPWESGQMAIHSGKKRFKKFEGRAVE